MLAASLTPQPQASQIPLLNIEKAGWSFPETLDGQIVRWVGKSFEIEFAWPFDAPWRLDVTAARLFGGEQVKEAKAFAGDQALPTSGQVGADRKSGVVTVSGAGDRHRPTHKVRVELPWAYKPDGDNRELGLLVQSVRVSPDQSVKALEEVGRIEVLTKVARTEQGFWLDRIVSGRAVMNPRGENWLHFTVRTEGGPEIAHAIELYVNGVPASLDRVAVSASVWAFRAKCGPDVLAAVGLWADWDLALRKAGAPPVGVADLRVSDSAEFSVLPGPRIEAPAQIGVAETRVVAAIAIDKADIAPREGKQTLFTARDISDQATGFYHLEPVDNGSSIRWTGPARESRFSLRIDRSSPVVLIVRFASLGQNRADQVSIKIDEKVYSLSEDSPEKDTFCIGPLSSTLDSAETRLILRVSQLMRPWEDGSADGRELGVALEWIKAEKWLEQEREAS